MAGHASEKITQTDFITKMVPNSANADEIKLITASKVMFKALIQDVSN